MTKTFQFLKISSQVPSKTIETLTIKFEFRTSSHPCSSSATNCRLVQEEWSASGMNFLFMGVSRVTGRSARAVEPEGSPDLGLPRDLTSWGGGRANEK